MLDCALIERVDGGGGGYGDKGGRGSGIEGAGDGDKGGGGRGRGGGDGGRVGWGREILGAGVIPKFVVFTDYFYVLQCNNWVSEVSNRCIKVNSGILTMNPADFTTDEECSANRGLH